MSMMVSDDDDDDRYTFWGIVSGMVACDDENAMLLI